MGCVQTKTTSKKTPSLPIYEEKKLIYNCFQQGRKYITKCGKEYHIVRDGTKLVKVPILKTLQKNPLYMKRATSLSDFSGSPTKTL